MPKARPADCAAGDEALRRGAWEEARTAFETALRRRETPEALEGLGLASWWLDRAEAVFDTRERAYRAYLSRRDRVAAARVAVWLGWDSWAFRGEAAVAKGWMHRARRLLKGSRACSEAAWLELREGVYCLLEEGDPKRARTLANRGIKVAKAAGDGDLEMMGRALEGLALVTSGAVDEGMRRLDEVNAAIVAGELKDLVAIGLASCYMIVACERVRDCDRAIEWCTRLKEFSARSGFRPLFAVCRTQYASICIWRGLWPEAEQELKAAKAELAASRPAMTSDALVRLAELRRRQGRLPEAQQMFEREAASGRALLGRAEVAFDRGDHRAAAEQATRYLRRVPPDNRSDRAEGLQLVVRARSALRNVSGAEQARAELAKIAALASTPPLLAAASMAAGYVAAAKGHEDEARQHFEDAVDRFLVLGAPFELARARLELARALGGLGRADDAIREAQDAVDLLARLEAKAELARAREFLDELSTSPPADTKPGRDVSPGSRLTKREVEVLRLVADGLKNQAIAERLFVSDHTVHRHLANILNKLSVGSRAAAVASAARRGLLT
jgi:LuxR family transcriptional regulator, maltose regulon positive regulatory protein